MIVDIRSAHPPERNALYLPDLLSPFTCPINDDTTQWVEAARAALPPAYDKKARMLDDMRPETASRVMGTVNAQLYRHFKESGVWPEIAGVAEPFFLMPPCSVPYYHNGMVRFHLKLQHPRGIDEVLRILYVALGSALGTQPLDIALIDVSSYASMDKSEKDGLFKHVADIVDALYTKKPVDMDAVRVLCPDSYSALRTRYMEAPEWLRKRMIPTHDVGCAVLPGL